MCGNRKQNVNLDIKLLKKYTLLNFLSKPNFILWVSQKNLVPKNSVCLSYFRCNLLYLSTILGQQD